MIQRYKKVNRIQKENNKKYAGYTGEVLIEGFDSENSSVAFGKYTNFKMVYFPGKPELMNRYVNVRVTKTNKNSLLGEMIDA